MTSRGRVLLATESFAEAVKSPEELLLAERFHLVRNLFNRRLTRDDYPQLLAEADYVIAGLEPYDLAVFERYPRLKAISRIGIGVDAIDLAAARARGVAVYNTPSAPSRSVAELTIGFILCLMRGIRRMDAAFHGGQWKPYQGLELANRPIGLVGLGRVGRLVAAVLKTFGSAVAACDPVWDAPIAESLGVRRASLEEVLAESDLVSLHLPLNGTTRHLMDATRLELMRQGAYLINTSRGGIVDDAELLKRLRSGRLAGAALDVFEREPDVAPYAGVPNLLVSPHVGSHTVEARFRMEAGAVENLLAFVRASEAGQPAPPGPIL